MNSPYTITRWGRVQRGSSFYCIKSARQTDTLIVKSIDRLGRNYNEILKQWQKITKEIGADIFVIDLPLLDTRRKEKNVHEIFAVTKLTKELLDEYVESIEVHPGDEVRIRWK